ncbi:hypothetical protein SNOG_14213 [Parastagonospora nodorum SN15]|uniref:Uncharacterized protein n=1 Tax=Phaeosphaeria nodorum (strain SN15 / ATCC MYA-4574 / FGSC 10173) TaxID=321614 RepID=Q0U253_PHANO|nr:hypothetical protein SNOG_14213 [Parastagonospora nodorum SN15]EAT78450.1 hypothetical protein SNOG_14213 [Parastagonospora nodorum SN15]
MSQLQSHALADNTNQQAQRGAKDSFYVSKGIS